LLDISESNLAKTGQQASLRWKKNGANLATKAETQPFFNGKNTPFLQLFYTILTVL
jgi:hypothetical protein